MPMTEIQALADPFAPDEIRWRVGQVAKNGKTCTVLAFIDARAVMDRLDEVVGPARWRDSYRAGPDGGLICRLEILLDGQWIPKEDAAENTDVEAVKGGISDAFKRAAVKWGIGRYLYRLGQTRETIKLGPNEWANGRGVDVSTKADGHVGWVPYPTLPAWALPTRPDEIPAPHQHHASWAADSARFHGDIGRIGWAYDEVVALCDHIGKPRPSEMTVAKRAALLEWLTTDAANAKWDEMRPAGSSS